MKKLLSVIVALFLCFGFAACEQKGEKSGADNMPEAEHQYDVAHVKLDINAKKQYAVQQLQLNITNKNGSGDTVNLIDKKPYSGIYNWNYSTEVENQGEQLIVCDTGVVRLNLKLSLYVMIGYRTWPFVVEFDGDYYTRSSDNEILLYTDENCLEKASFEYTVDNYSFEDIDTYTDHYTVTLQIFWE